MGEEGYVEDTG